MVQISSQIGQETRSNGLDIQSDWTEDPLRMSRSSCPFHLDIFPTVHVGQIEQRLCHFHSYLQGAEYMLVLQQGRGAIVGREKNNQTGDQNW